MRNKRTPAVLPKPTMTRTAFIKSLTTETPIVFIDNHLFDRIPAIFENDRPQFINWKRTLAEKIEVDSACIMIVGSAATGTSLNPSKNFRPFDEKSDVDVAVVSPYHFTVGWRYLRMNSARRLRVDARTRIAWDEHVNRYIYWGTLATDRLLGVLPFGLQWLNAITDIAQHPPTLGRSVNLRIYADYDSLRAYQIQGVRTLRNSIIG
jgi:predicted nucleotidyltransferase